VTTQGLASGYQVALLRDVPEERRLSMERFADALEEALGGSPDRTIVGRTVHESPMARRLHLQRAGGYLTRYVHYPLAAARMTADIYHIVDQGYAHVSMFLPFDRTVVTCHDLMLLRAEEGGTGFRGTRKSLLRYRWSTGYLRKVARVACVSRSTQSDAARILGVDAARLIVIPPGVSHTFRRLTGDELATARSRLNWPNDSRCVLLHVSSGHYYKNVPATLRVLRALIDAGIAASLVRVGRPMRPAEIDLCKDLRLEGAVRELGLVSEEQLVEAYNLADILLFPSHYEGFGWPPLEAMACGTPVVCSAAPSLVEVVGSAALTASATDIAGLTRAVREVLGSKELSTRLTTLGLERAAEFSWRRNAEAYAAVYEEVLREASVKSPTRAWDFI
jgi:glycosyltransferase involved in cell wall biosynthesis